MTGRRVVALLTLCLLSTGCTERLTPSRAGTIIRHSKAFLSGPPESQPVFDGVSALLPGPEASTPEGREGESCVVEFSYHWPEEPKAAGAGGPVAELTGRLVLRRLGNGWDVDDDASRTLDPSWPRLSRASSFSWPADRPTPGSPPNSRP